ncbi:hypothetical protein P5673_004012 [Acropora cervicornis]|uniref:Uncharacterized protein n=1 Tax=Acropora cervicornis TaxID=6130 RepID=A0AAD9R1M0_ACRCE|nr:hypothetical protein P5673_004012 [Acropora cervicornis]
MPFADNVFISFMFFKFAGYNLPVKKNKGETLSNFYNNYLPKTFLKTHIQLSSLNLCGSQQFNRLFMIIIIINHKLQLLRKLYRKKIIIQFTMYCLVYVIIYKGAKSRLPKSIELKGKMIECDNNGDYSMLLETLRKTSG